MFATAKIITDGNSQAIRLPKEFKFENQEELYIKKVGDGVLLLPKKEKQDSWDEFFDQLKNFPDDFMQTRGQPTHQQREELF